MKSSAQNLAPRTKRGSSKGKKRGFSLIELSIVVAIVGVAAMVAVPMLRSVNQRSQVRRELRLISSALERCRAIARSRRAVNPGATGFAIIPTRTCGLRVTANDRYLLFASSAVNGIGGTELIIQPRVFPNGIGLQIGVPPGDIVFRSDGTLLTTSPNQLVLTDTGGDTHTLTISLTGQISID